MNFGHLEGLFTFCKLCNVYPRPLGVNLLKYLQSMSLTGMMQQYVPVQSENSDLCTCTTYLYTNKATKGK